MWGVRGQEAKREEETLEGEGMILYPDGRTAT